MENAVLLSKETLLEHFVKAKLEDARTRDGTYIDAGGVSPRWFALCMKCVCEYKHPEFT